jgi:hypothetical protein
MPVYADIPTVGLPAETAQHLATFLRYAATDGERAGTANGELPPGYLPLTKTNGLQDLAAFTGRAAAAVAQQKGALPPLQARTSVPPSGPGSTPTAPAGPPPSVPAGAGGVGGGAPVPPAGSTQPGAAGGAPSSAPVSISSTSAPGSIGVRATGAYSTLGSLTLPIALLLAALCALVGSALRYPERRRAVLVRLRAGAVSAGGRIGPAAKNITRWRR